MLLIVMSQKIESFLISFFIVTWKKYELPHNKTNKMTASPAKTQISLGICPVWSESSLCTQLVAKDPSFLHADSEDSNQTGGMPRLICIFAGCPVILLIFSRGSSYVNHPFFWFQKKKKGLQFTGVGWVVKLEIESRKLDEFKDELDELLSWRTSWVSWMSSRMSWISCQARG